MLILIYSLHLHVCLYVVHIINPHYHVGKGDSYFIYTYKTQDIIKFGILMCCFDGD